MYVSNFDTHNVQHFATRVNHLHGHLFETYQRPDKASKICHVVRFGDRLRARREALGLSQEKVAELIGEIRTNYNGVENNRRNISEDKLEKLAGALQVTLEKLQAWRAMDEYPPKVINIASADTLTIDFIKEELLPRLSKEDKAELLKGLKKQ